ncbi:NOV [Symbiodinium microadriaticum]|nr:NOV [Symbiodinium microadriaticum]
MWNSVGPNRRAPPPRDLVNKRNAGRTAWKPVQWTRLLRTFRALAKQASDSSLGALRASAQKTQVALSAAVDRLAQDLYELEGHFVFELVQNADDNKYSEDVQPELFMSLQTDGSGSYFMTKNNELGLKESDVMAMCDINASSKSSGCIGKKGIGWKSTFAVSQCPHVLSGDFTFKFDVGGALGKLAYVTPTWLEDSELEKLPKPVQDAHQSAGTVIYLPLRTGSDSIAEAFDRLCQHHVTLLLLKQLRRIQLEYPGGNIVCLERLERAGLVQSISMLGSREPAESQEEKEAKMFQYMVHPFQVQGVDPGGPVVMRLVFPIADCPPRMSVHVGLPVRCVGFHFAVDAPFDLVASRADLHEGSTVNQILCNAIPQAFGDFLAGPGHDVSCQAMRFVGCEAAPRPIWQHVRTKLVDSLLHVACIRTEEGAVAKPEECFERPQHPLRVAASQLIPAKLLQLSCGRSFASSSSVATVGVGAGVLEVFSLEHWIKVLRYRGSSWPCGLVGSAAQTEDPCEFFVPFCTWLDMELREAEQPSQLLAQVWDVDLLPAFRSRTPLRISDGPIFSRPCVKIRADWQGFLSEVGLLKFVEPRVRLALQNATPHLMESLTMGMPSRPELAALCISWHLTSFNGLGVTAEPTPMKALLASLACLKETFLSDELPDGSRLGLDLPLPLPKADPEARQAWWRELGTWLWLPGLQMSSNARLSLRRPQKLQSSSYLGFTCADESRPLDTAVVQDIFSQKTWGEDALGWEAFLHAIGVQNFQPAEAEHTQDLASRLGASLCTQEWWSGLLKRGLRAQAYVSRRCRGADDAESHWLRTLPIAVQVDAPKGQGPMKDRKVLRKIHLQDFFLHDVYGRLGGQYLHYVRLPGSGSTRQPAEDELVRRCLQCLGVQVELSAAGLLRSLRLLKDEGRCQNIEVYADIYKEVASGFGSIAEGGLSRNLREALSELVFVPLQFRHLDECTWEEDGEIQWLTQVPSLQAHYLRYGPSVRHYFLDVLGMPETHPGFSPGSLLTALRNLVKHVEDALSSPTLSESLQQTPTTARGLLESMTNLASKVYSSLAKACRTSSVTWHADVRRAFSQERLLLLPPLELPDLTTPLRREGAHAQGRSNMSRQDQQRTRSSSGTSSLPAPDASRRHRPKRLYTKESWWEVEDELKETKATNLNLSSLYGGIHDAEFLFLRVIGIRRLASRGDVVQRLRESMSSTGPLSNWTEGIDISDLEELENIQTSSYFRPADWRAPGEEDDGADDSGQEAPTERASASFRPPQTTGSAHPPAWRSPEAARDAEDRANAALRADAARREAEETAARAKAKAKAKAAATTAESRGRVPIRVEGINTSLCDVMQRKPGSVAVGAGGAAQALELFLGDFSFSPRRAALRQRFSWQRFREAHTEASQGAPQSTALGAGDSPAGVPVPPAESPRHFGWHLEFDPSMLAKRKTEESAFLQACEQNAQQRQSEPTLEAKLSGSAESLQAQENQDLPHLSAADGHEDADALQLRLAALRAAAQCRKTEVEDLRRERQGVEETTQRYLRILQGHPRGCAAPSTEALHRHPGKAHLQGFPEQRVSETAWLCRECGQHSVNHRERFKAGRPSLVYTSSALFVSRAAFAQACRIL